MMKRPRYTFKGKSLDNIESVTVDVDPGPLDGTEYVSPCGTYTFTYDIEPVTWPLRLVDMNTHEQRRRIAEGID